jgi:hypothetical protein
MALRFTRTLSVPITEEQADALDAMALASGKPQTELVRTLIARALVPDPIEVTLLAELLFIRRVLLNGPTHAKAIDETKQRDAKLILAGKPLPYGATR